MSLLTLLFSVPGVIMLVAPEVFFKINRRSAEKPVSSAATTLLRILGVALLIAGLLIASQYGATDISPKLP